MAEANSTPTRVCTCCKIEFPATREHFHACKHTADGCRAVCRTCRAKDNAEHREERAAKKRAFYAANKDRLLANVKDYYARNVEAQREAARKRHERNRDRNNKRSLEYREANKDSINAKRRESFSAEFKAKYKVDPEFTLRHRAKSLVRRTLSSGKGGRRLEEVLGFTLSELRAHLERQFTEGMTWERFFAGEIHIDHIIPASHFKFMTPDCPGFKACWALSNLRPAWATENLSKGKKILTLL